MTSLDKLKAGSQIAENGCWNWVYRIDRHGYGRVTIQRKVQLAHRTMYILTVGPIAEGMVIDHLCRNRRCINPAHMEIVTAAENNRRGESFTAQNARKTHCKHGHPFDEANTYPGPPAGRRRRTCRTCNSAAQARVAKRKKGISP